MIELIRTDDTMDLASLRFSEAHLSTGVRLRYAEQGNPAYPPLILLHGYTDSWFSFSRVLPSLAARYHVYAPSQRGHGDSERPAAGYAMTDFAADVVAFMDAMGLPNATVVGHSMGSIVAKHVALVAPQRVARLVLIGAATTWDTPEIREFLEVVNSLEDPVPAAFAQEFQASTIYAPLPAEFMNRVVAESHKLPAHVWRAALAGCLGADYSAKLGQIRMPVLLCWGEQDAYTPRAEQDALVAGLGDATLKVYVDTGHSPHWERPEQFVRDLDEFMLITERC
jgi:pimeloyl-ACP methyl ester carboxylesterase